MNSTATPPAPDSPSSLPASGRKDSTATRALDATLAAGPVSDTAYFEVDAAQGQDPSNTAAAVTEVYIVDQSVPGQPGTQGSLDHIGLSPSSSTVRAGAPVTYTVTGYDAASNDLGSVSGATLAISPDGSCAANTCKATAVGNHTVTAAYGTKTATATLRVATPSPPSAASDLAVGLAAPAKVKRKKRFTTMVRVTNRGPGTARGLATTLALPKRVRVVSAPGATLRAGVLTWRSTALATGHSVTYKVTLRVTKRKPKWLRLVSRTASTTRDPARGNNAAVSATRVR